MDGAADIESEGTAGSKAEVGGLLFFAEGNDPVVQSFRSTSVTMAGRETLPSEKKFGISDEPEVLESEAWAEGLGFDLPFKSKDGGSNV